MNKEQFKFYATAASSFADDVVGKSLYWVASLDAPYTWIIAILYTLSAIAVGKFAL